MGIIRRLVKGTEDLKEVFKLDIVYGKNHNTQYGGGNITVSVYAWYIEGNSIKSTLIDGSYVDGGSISISFKEPEYEVKKPYLLNGALYGDPEQVATVTTTHYATDIDYERTRY